MEEKDWLMNLTKHRYVELVSSGDGAIFLALSVAAKAGKNAVLIPDQGGWLPPQQPVWQL